MCDSQFDNKSKGGRRISSIPNKIFTIFLWQGNNGGGGRGGREGEEREEWANYCGHGMDEGCHP